MDRGEAEGMIESNGKASAHARERCWDWRSMSQQQHDSQKKRTGQGGLAGTLCNALGAAAAYCHGVALGRLSASARDLGRVGAAAAEGLGQQETEGREGSSETELELDHWQRRQAKQQMKVFGTFDWRCFLGRADVASTSKTSSCQLAGAVRPSFRQAGSTTLQPSICEYSNTVCTSLQAPCCGLSEAHTWRKSDCGMMTSDTRQKPAQRSFPCCGESQYAYPRSRGERIIAVA